MEQVERIIKSQRDYFQVLQVERDTPGEEIKKKYRALALQVHPDKNKSQRASEAFVILRRAYEELADERKRKLYVPGSDERRERCDRHARRYAANIHPTHEFEELIRAMMHQRPFGYVGAGLGGVRFSFGPGVGMGGFGMDGPASHLYRSRPSELSLSNYTVIFMLILLVVTMLFR